MDRWLSISDGANAALHALAYSAAKGGFVSARSVALALEVSPSYLAKLLQDLAIKGLVDVARGAMGGFAMAGDPEKTSVLEVIIAVDGPLPTRYCLFPEATCLSRNCAIKRLCDELAANTAKALSATMVADIAASYLE